MCFTAKDNATNAVNVLKMREAIALLYPFTPQGKFQNLEYYFFPLK